MSFKPYPKYKESGVEWLGRVPEHWGASRVRWLCQRYSGGTPDKAKAEYWEDGTIPWLNSGAVNDRLITEPSTLITEEAFANSSAKWIPPQSLLIALAGQGRTKGMVAQLAFRATCNQSMAALVPGKQVESRFLYWWLESNYQNIRNMAGGDLRDGLNLELIGDIPCPLPVVSEQNRIATFLDHETAKIDALIAEQQRLIELLQEKRQAVISHAVTKGLSPDAPMKDSGIEWLGEVPEHWEVGPLKRFCSSLDGRRVPLSTEERSHRQGNYPYYGASGIIDSVDDFLFDEDLVLVSEDGANLLNRSTPIAFVATGQYWVNNHAHIVRPIDGYLHYWAERIEAIDLAPFVSGSAQPKFTAEALFNLKVAIPPTDSERAAIQDHFLGQTVAISELIGQASQAVTLLQERRSALISAAVTGQIDVREFAPDGDSEAA